MTDPASPAEMPDGDPAELLGRGLAAVREVPGEPEVAAAREAGECMRALIGRLTATSAPAEVLEEAAARLREVEELLRPYQSIRRYGGSAEASGLWQGVAFFDWSPQLGLANPLAPPVHASVEDGVVVGRARFGIAYEGPPGCVHGGCIAAAFDEVLGLAQTLSGRVGMTGTLTVKYRRPTPLNADLRFEGRLESVQGRKVTTSGRLFSGPDLTAEATGLFVAISAEHFHSLESQRDRGGR